MKSFFLETPTSEPLEVELDQHAFDRLMEARQTRRETITLTIQCQGLTDVVDVPEQKLYLVH